MRRRWCTAAFLALAMHASSGRAQEGRSEYDRLVDEALSEFDAGHYEEALSAFEQAYKVKPSARALRGVAKALFELRAYARCVATIDRALASEDEPLTGALRTDVESLRERAMHFVGEAIVDVTPAEATVVLDGEAVAAPFSRVVDVGPHTLDVSAPDHQPQSRRFEIHGGETTRVSVRLDRVQTTPIFVPPQAQPASESRTVPLVLSIVAIVASTGALVGASIWFVDRGTAVDRCNDAAAAGARCANADSIAFQRNASAWTVVVSGSALVASAFALVVVLRGGEKRAAR